MTDQEKNNNKNENPFTQDINAESVAVEEEQPTQEQQPEVDNELEEIKTKYEKLAQEFETKNSQYVRLAADFDNYRKRQAQERESLLKYGAEDTLKKILPILDTFERAEKSFREIDNPAQLKECFDAVQKQFLESLEKIGLQKIETVGQEFDPNVHEAVMQTPTQDHPDHTIIAELQSGYKLHDRIVRPALVNVAVDG